MSRALWVLFLAAAGCSSGPSMAEVKGKVTLDGKPLDSGTMAFIPQKDDLPSSGCEIKNGEYAGRIPVGPMQVRINARKVVGERLRYADDPSSKMPITSEALPARYNDESTLQLDVKPGVNEKNFELTSQ